MRDKEVNFLAETLKCLKNAGKTPADVRWCGLINHEKNDENYRRVTINVSFSWSDFEQIADFDYDNGFGGNNIPMAFYIVGDDWWLERGEYDGSEWWEFKTMPIQPPLGSLHKLLEE